MKRIENKKNGSNLDKVEKKKAKAAGSVNKRPKRRLSIYDDFDDNEAMLDYSSPFEFFDD